MGKLNNIYIKETINSKLKTLPKDIITKNNTINQRLYTNKDK